MKTTLATMKKGGKGKVIEISGGRMAAERLASMGIRPGVLVRKITGSFLHGPVCVSTGNTCFAIGRDIAEKITIETDVPK